MITPQIPPDEEQRLRALKQYNILDTLPEALYDDITKIASEVCGTPISLISLIDESRQWFKSHHGLDVSETNKDLAYCAHAINDPDHILEVQDAFADERFHDNPLATGEPHVRFYAGAPLKTLSGHTIGTLCVIDHEKKKLTSAQRETLWALSRQVVALLELRKENGKRKQSDNDLRNVFDNLGDAVFELDEEGICTYTNSRMAEVLNISVDNIVNAKIWDKIYYEDLAEMKKFYGSIFRARKRNCYYQFRLQPVGAPPLWVEQNTTMEYDGKKMVRLRSIARDISEIKKLRNDLDAKESLFKLVSENSRDFIALHAPDGTYQYVSPSSTELTGYTPEELLGTDPYDIIHPDDIERMRGEPLRKTLDGVSMKKVEYRIVRKDNSILWLESYSKPIFDKDNNVTSFQTSCRDITERNAERIQLEIEKEKAEQASKAKNTFLSTMSHEIRTPLNGIIGTTHLLLNKSPKDYQKPYLNILKQSGNNLLAIVNDILDFNKVEEGKLTLDHSEFNLQEVIKAIYDNYRIQAEEKRIDLWLKFDDSLSGFHIGDSFRISQIIHNLVSNAIKFTKTGSVTVIIKKNNSHDQFDEVCFYVNDTGIGIPEKKQDEIFELFVQAEKSTSRDFGGSGLGLAITKRLLNLMNSKIEVSSTIDVGSSFKFKLVLERSENQERVVNYNKNKKGSLKLSANILLVEDNDFNRAIAKDFLESWDCKVIESGNGLEAIEALKKNDEIDLILMDLQMPVMDGFEAVRRIRADEASRLKEIPIVALTAAAMGDIKSEVFSAGMNDFISKPFLPEDFYSKILQNLRKQNENELGDDINQDILRNLQKTLGDEKEIASKYFNIFIKTLTQGKSQLKEAIETKNVKGIQTYMHKIKTNFRLVGLIDLGKEAEQIEEMIDKNSLEKMVLNKSEKHYLQVVSLLKKLSK